MNDDYLTSNQPGELQRNESPVLKAEYLIALLFIFLAGFLGSQKILHSLTSNGPGTGLDRIIQSACNKGIRIPGLACQAEEDNALALLEPIQQDSSQDSNGITSQLTSESQSTSATNLESSSPELEDSSIDIQLVSPVEAYRHLPLRSQFAHLPDLKSAINQLNWNDGDGQEAARLLSIVRTLTLGRQREAYKNQQAAAAITRLLEPVWQRYPGLVAASHCLYCGSFFSDVLIPFLKEGSSEEEWLLRLAGGHSRLARALYDAGQIEIADLDRIASLQAALTTAGDRETARFIGNVLRKNGEFELLENWSTRGLNGHYAFQGEHNLDDLPRQLIINTWEAAVRRGSDNARLTRFLIASGYRPALRWAIWLMDGTAEYLRSYSFKYEQDRYRSFLRTHLDFPANSFSDLGGFYSQYWSLIRWDEAARQWVVDSTG